VGAKAGRKPLNTGPLDFGALAQEQHLEAAWMKSQVIDGGDQQGNFFRRAAQDPECQRFVEEQGFRRQGEGLETRRQHDGVFFNPKSELALISGEGVEETLTLALSME